MRNSRNVHRVFVEKYEENRILKISKGRWELLMDRKGAGQEGVDWINLTQDRDNGRAVLYTAMNLRVP
jgi:hypothetical protein